MQREIVRRRPPTFRQASSGSVLGRTGRQPVDRIEDVGDVRSVLSELAARDTREVLITQPGGPRPESAHCLRGCFPISAERVS